MKLVLAANEVRQLELLKQTGYQPTMAPPMADLEQITDIDPVRLTVAQALAKARSVREKYKQAVVIATSSVLVYRNRVAPQPKFKMDALRLLEQLAGQSHTIVTGWGLYDTITRAKRQGSSITKITFKEIGSKILLDYVNDHEVVKYLGGYDLANTRAIAFIDRVEGSLTNITHHFPLESILPTLAKQMAE